MASQIFTHSPFSPTFVSASSFFLSFVFLRFCKCVFLTFCHSVFLDLRLSCMSKFVFSAICCFSNLWSLQFRDNQYFMFLDVHTYRISDLLLFCLSIFCVSKNFVFCASLRALLQMKFQFQLQPRINFQETEKRNNGHKPKTANQTQRMGTRNKG